MLLRSTATGQAARLRWDILADGITEAVATARAADVAVVVVGNDPMIGAREGHDRSTLALPPSMDRLIREVVGANPRTVLVIMSSYPYVTPDAPAIVWTCHAGQETGHAIAELLTGRHAPQGRLPQTWYAADSAPPDALDYDIIKAGWMYQYSGARARFPSGHGLTYTKFRYGPLRPAGTAGDTVTASRDVTNTGDRDETEVVQLYASYPAPDQPRRRRRGFDRVTLAPGETKTVRIEVPRARLALWDVAAARMSVLPGQLELGAGASCADIRQTATLTVPGTVSEALDWPRWQGKRGRLRRLREHHPRRPDPRDAPWSPPPIPRAVAGWRSNRIVWNGPWRLCSASPPPPLVAAGFRRGARPGQSGRQRRRALDRRSLRVDRRHGSAHACRRHERPVPRPGWRRAPGLFRLERE